MAQPYQDLQGNWFTDGRQMTPQEAMALGVGQPQAAPGQMAPAPLQAVPGQPAPQAAPGTGMTAEQFLAAATADTQRRQRVGLNPIGAIADFFRK